MEFLSLQEPLPQPAPRLSRTEAILVSSGLHLLAFLLFLFLPSRLPESFLALFRAGPRITAEAPPSTADQDAARQPAERADQPKIPLKFAYVKVPDDAAVPRNRSAPLLSDKNRRARQEVPTPPGLREFSIDPHSQGDTIDRVRPDPSVPEGPESAEPAPRPADAAGSGRGKTLRRTDRGPKETEAAGSPALEGPAPRTPGVTGESEGGRQESEEEIAEGAGADERSTDLKEALSNLRAGEYKFQFNNPGYLRDGSYGTMSFDTKDFPWGDYARRIYVVIRNNWFARYPLAAREGIRGFVCWRFIIEKDGTISRILPVRPSSIPPFDKAAADALEASSPLPPLPESFPNDREGVTACFYYNMFSGEAE